VSQQHVASLHSRTFKHSPLPCTGTCTFLIGLCKGSFCVFYGPTHVCLISSGLSLPFSPEVSLLDRNVPFNQEVLSTVVTFLIFLVLTSFSVLNTQTEAQCSNSGKKVGTTLDELYTNISRHLQCKYPLSFHFSKHKPKHYLKSA
jgi:hypothetical protein